MAETNYSSQLRMSGVIKSNDKQLAREKNIVLLFLLSLRKH